MHRHNQQVRQQNLRNYDNLIMSWCVLVYSRYLDNIIDHPGDEKYRKIRIGNKAFSVKTLATKMLYYTHNAECIMYKCFPFTHSLSLYNWQAGASQPRTTGTIFQIIADIYYSLHLQSSCTSQTTVGSLPLTS